VDPGFADGDAGGALIDQAWDELAKHGVRQIRVCIADRESDEQFIRLGFRSAVQEMVLESNGRGRRGKRASER
jgi:hypothetical protein